jgi:hypothetical protein
VTGYSCALLALLAMLHDFAAVRKEILPGA